MITARFEEFEFYDPIKDAERVRLMCITNVGTWHTTVDMGTGSKMRDARKRFRMAIEHDVAFGIPPGELILEQEIA